MLTDPPLSRASPLPQKARALARAQVLLLGDAAAFGQTQVSQCLSGNLGWQWDVAVLDHNFLTLLGQDQLQELSFQRGQRLVRRLVDVDVEETRQWVLAVQGDRKSVV